MNHNNQTQPQPIEIIIKEYENFQFSPVGVYAPMCTELINKSPEERGYTEEQWVQGLDAELNRFCESLYFSKPDTRTLLKELGGILSIKSQLSRNLLFQDLISKLNQIIALFNAFLTATLTPPPLTVGQRHYFYQSPQTASTAINPPQPTALPHIPATNYHSNRGY
jgi:hypothetical protein